jgi:hypothetical protein
MPFSYPPLGQGPKAIRLLLVEAGLEDETIHCTLILSDLDETSTPAYETISYCWGDQNLRDEVVLNGHLFTLPASSVAAIRRLRLPGRARTLWIDAICIDQTKIEERNRQVPLMKEIYSRSDGTLIYLGEPDGAEAEALSNIRAHLEEAASATRDFVEFGNVVMLGSSALSAPKTEIRVDALYSLYSRPWFRSE